MCNRSSTKYMIYPSSYLCSLPSRYMVPHQLRRMVLVTLYVASSLEVTV